MIGLLQEADNEDAELEERLDMEVRRTVTSGSLNITAVAGTVLGTVKPVTSNSVENIVRTTAPVIPDTRPATSAKTTAF